MENNNRNIGFNLSNSFNYLKFTSCKSIDFNY